MQTETRKNTKSLALFERKLTALLWVIAKCDATVSSELIGF